MNKLIPLVLLVGWSCVTMAQIQPTDTLVLSLPEAQNVALDNNFTLQEQRIDVDIAKSKVEQTKAQGLPQINGSFDYQYTILNAFASRTSSDDGEQELPPLQGNYQYLTTNEQGDAQGIALESIGVFFNNIGDAFASRHQGTAGVSVNQKVFDGVYLLGLQAAEVYVDLARAQTATTERDVLKNVEKAYYSALITEENIGIIDKNIVNVEQLLFETRETYEAGFVEQLDVDRLALSLSTLENNKRNLIKLKELNYDVLKSEMRIPLNTNISLSQDVEQFAAVALSDEVLNKVQDPEQWPEFYVLDVQEQVAELQIEQYKKGRLPKVDAFLNGSYGYQGNDFIFTNGFDNWFPNAVAGLSVSVPIFDGNLKDNQIREKQLELDKLNIQRASLQSNINIQIQNALTSYLNARADVQNQIDNIALAEKIYETTQIKYREGVGSSVEMSQAQQELYQAQQQYINSLYDLLIAKVDLEKALGK